MSVSPRRRLWPLLFYCLAVVLLAYGGGLEGAFLNFDDDRTVLQNPAFQAGFPAGLSLVLDPTSRIADVYLPVTYLSLWIDWGLFGASLPGGYHLHALLLHALAGFVLILLLCDLGIGRWAASLAVLPFLTHPALCESVLWISSRKDVLSGLLVLLALWLGRLSCRGRVSAVVVLGCVLLACYSKASAVVVPLYAWPLWRMRLAPDTRSRSLRLGIATTWIAMTAALHHGLLAAAAGTTGFESRLASVPGTFLHYVEVLAWPVELAVHRPRELLDLFAEGAAGKTIALLLVVVGALVLLRKSPRSWRPVGLGVLLVFAALLPFNGFLPAFAVAAADRYLYLAVPALALGLAAFLQALPHPLRRAALVATAAGGVLLAGVSRVRAPAFTRSDRLWQANLAVYPDDAVSLVNLAQWHLSQADRGGAARAEKLLKRARRSARSPAHRLRATVQLFRCGLARGDLAQARRWIEEAVALVDGMPDTMRRARIDLRLQWADLLDRLGRPQESGRVLDQILESAPHHSEALAHKALHATRESAAAARQLPLAPSSLREAKRWIDRAAAGVPAAASLYLTLALSEYHRLLGHTTRAAGVLAAYRGPAREEIPLQAARIYQAEGLLGAAIRELERGLVEIPGAAIELAIELADLYMQDSIRRYADAEKLLRDVYEAAPEHPRVRAAYGRALALRARQMVGVRPVAEYAALVRRAGVLAPELAEIRWLEAIVLDHEHRTEAALARAREAAKALPERRAVQDLLLQLIKKNGFRALLAGDREAAFRHFRELLDLAPEDFDFGSVIDLMRGEFEARHRAATLSFSQDRLAQAEASFRRALELFPDHADALLKLGMVLYAQGRNDASLRCLAASMQSAEKRGADPGMALLYRLQVLRDLKREREALQLAEPYLAEKGRIHDARIRGRILRLVERLRGS